MIPLTKPYYLELPCLDHCATTRPHFLLVSQATNASHGHWYRCCGVSLGEKEKGDPMGPKSVAGSSFSPFCLAINEGSLVCRQIPPFLFFESRILRNHVPFLMANPGYQAQEKSTPHFLGAKIRIPIFLW